MLKEEYSEEFKINAIRSITELSPRIRKSMIQSSRTSTTNIKHSSLKTIFSISNTMVGSSVLVMPLCFQQSGLILSSLICAFIGLLSTKTASLVLRHFRPNEMDLSDAVLRILGKPYHLSYIFSSILLLYVASLVYFLLSANLFYDLITLIVSRFSPDYVMPGKDSIVYDQFSFQYAGILLFVWFACVFMLKDLKLFIKAGSLGILAIFTFILYMFVLGVMNINSNLGEVQKVPLFTSQVADSFGVFAVSFFIHSMLIPIIKNNRHYHHNQRDLTLGFCLTGGIYISIGAFGACAIAGRQIDNPQTALDYLKDYDMTIVISLFLLVQLLTSLPLVWYITRSQIFAFFYKDKLPKDRQLNKIYLLANLSFLIISLVMQQMNTNIQKLISIDGAICGFWLIYVIPVKLHLNCLYSAQHSLSSPLTPSKDEGNLISNVQFDSQKSNSNNLMDLSITSLGQQKETKSTHSHKYNSFCKSMHIESKRGTSESIRKLFYYAIVATGFTILVFKFLQLAQVVE